MKNMKKMDTKTIVGIALLTAIVVVLQLTVVIKFSVFAISVTLVPIIIGGALYGTFAGAWLGFVFGLAVLLSGDAASFMALSPFGTIVTVLLKGIAAGYFSALVYNLFNKMNKNVLGTYLAGVVSPIANTGVFVLGCFIFFIPGLREWAIANDFDSVVKYIFVGLVGVNFFLEFAINMVLGSVIVRILKVIKLTERI